MKKALLAVAGVLARGQPEPRSAEYFQGHPTEATRVIADCKSGGHRGRECETAQAAANADRRLEPFCRSFR